VIRYKVYWRKHSLACSLSSLLSGVGLSLWLTFMGSRLLLFGSHDVIGHAITGFLIPYPKTKPVRLLRYLFEGAELWTPCAVGLRTHMSNNDAHTDASRANTFVLSNYKAILFFSHFAAEFIDFFSNAVFFFCHLPFASVLQESLRNHVVPISTCENV